MCGNLGLLFFGKSDELPKPGEALELMGKITSMRGAQSFGFAASSRNKMFVYKAVVKKRGDIAVQLSRSFNKVVQRKKSTPLAVAAHFRFATSSKTTKRDAHPHVWLEDARANVVTVNPSTGTFNQRSVSRAVVVTHNGDFEAFDLGACFGRDSKVVDLDSLRKWLKARLGAPAPSAGDSIVAAGLLELLFAAGDPYASTRLAFAAMDDVDCEPPPRDVIQAAANVLRSTLLSLAHTIANQLSYTLNGQLTAETRERQMSHVVDVVVPALKANGIVSTYLSARYNLEISATLLARVAVGAFFEADLRSATRRFLKHANGSFGLVVSTSLAPCALVVASVKQPMTVGLGRGFVVYGSERAAIHAGKLGEALKARRVLHDGEVLWFAPATASLTMAAATTTHESATCPMASASIHDDDPFRPLNSCNRADFDEVSLQNALVMRPVPPSTFQGDVVGNDIAEIPTVLRNVRDSFQDAGSFNSLAAKNLAQALFFFESTNVENAKTTRAVDLVVVGVESSLWLSEQWAANLRSVFPKLRVIVASSNKVLASLTAVANDSTCGAQTPGYTVFPSGLSPAESVRGAVALVVSHSGQTFPSLNASRALKKAGATVFAVAGLQDTVIASDVLEQSFAVGAQHSGRLFSTEAGIRLAEAASLTTVAIHVLLTEILYSLASNAREQDTVLISSDLRDLRTLQDECVDNNLAMLCHPTPTNAKTGRAPVVDVETPPCPPKKNKTHPFDSAMTHGRRWGNHVLEPAVAFLLAVAYVLGTVTAGTPLLSAVVSAVWPHTQPSVYYAVAFLDALLYAFFPVVAALFLRFFQNRVLLARFGKRTVIVLDVPQVHQCVVAFTQKLFGLAYGLNGVEVAGFNPSDHAVHRCLHRVVRGTLVALGVPDGRLRALIDSECAAYLSASQIKSIENWGVGPELVSVGHHTYNPSVIDGAIIFDSFNRPAFLSEVAHGTASKDVAHPHKEKQASLVFSGNNKNRGASTTLQTSTSDARRIAFLGNPSEKEVYQSDAIIGSGSSIAVGKKKSHANIREVVASHTVVETLYEGRIATLERQCAFYVFFYAAAARASSALWPIFSFDTWRSQAGTRVATTPSPTSPSTTEVVSRERTVMEERVTTQDDFFRRGSSSQPELGHFFHIERHRKAYDVLRADDEDSDPGLDLSAHDAWMASFSGKIDDDDM